MRAQDLTAMPASKGGHHGPEVKHLSLEEVLALDESSRQVAAEELSARAHLSSPMERYEEAGRLLLIRTILERRDRYEKLYTHYVMRSLGHVGVTEGMFPLTIEIPEISADDPNLCTAS
jgi:hypothetical protein